MQNEVGTNDQVEEADAPDATEPVIQPDVADLRELLQRRKVDSEIRLFSAAAAGITPRFLQDDIAASPTEG